MTIGAARPCATVHKSNLRGASESAPDSLICAQVRRWGALAGAGKEDRDWKLFVESRLSTPPPVSPIDFLQEYYVACGVVRGAFDFDARRRVDGLSGANPVTYRRSSHRPPTRGDSWFRASS